MVEGYRALMARVHTLSGALRRLVGAGTVLTAGALPALHYSVQSARSFAYDIERAARVAEARPLRAAA